MTSGHLNELWGFVWSFIFLAPNKLMEYTKMGRAGTEIDGHSHCEMKARWCGNKTGRKQVWMMCLGVSLQQVTKFCSKCDSFHFWQLGENKGQTLPAVLDTRIAASGTSDINDIGVFIWFKTSTSAKEASAAVTKCNWGYWSMTQVQTVGASLTLLRLREYWEPMAPAPHSSPKGSARADRTAQLDCLIHADYPIPARVHLWLKPSRHNNVPTPAHLIHSIYMFILSFWLFPASPRLFPMEIIVSITH